MQTEMILPDDIRYNAADGAFEARVTLHGADGTRTYACWVERDISMSLEHAAIALRAEAIRRHTTAPELFAAQKSLSPAPMRAVTRPRWRDGLLRALPLIRGLRAA